MMRKDYKSNDGLVESKEGSLEKSNDDPRLPGSLNGRGDRKKTNEHIPRQERVEAKGKDAVKDQFCQSS